MVIGVWFLIVLSTIIIFGEMKYRYFDKQKGARKDYIASDNWKDSVDIDMDELSMEHTSNEFVYSQSLAMRGSWRLAQERVMGAQSFRMLSTEEYAKMLR
jgi:hypothetical protein